MLIPILIMLAVLFLVLAFVSVVTFKVGIIIAVACVILAFILTGNIRSRIL